MRLAMICIALVALTGLFFAYNFVFNPASSVHFTVYAPRQALTHSSHLVIPGYNKNSFTIFGNQQAKVGYAIMDGGPNIVQEKSTADTNCSSVKNCTTRRTVKGQVYHIGSISDSKQFVVLKKGDTKITIEGDGGRQLNLIDWDEFIDTFEPIAIDKLGYIFYFIGSEHEWRAV